MIPCAPVIKIELLYKTSELLVGPNPSAFLSTLLWRIGTMASPSPSSPSSPSSSGSLSCISLSSFLSMFLSCVQTPKGRGRNRRSPDPPPSTATTTINSNNNTRANGCDHHIMACTCICTLPPVNTALAKGSYPVPPASDDSNTISITQTTTTTTTSIRIVDSDTSSDYDSHSITSADTDANSVSDYGCGCGFGGDEHNCEDDIEDTNPDSHRISLPARPLPPVPVHRQSPSTSRRSSEVKTKTRLSCIEETIPEEEEEEVYLAQQRQEGDAKQHRDTTSRRKSMIELFNLSTSLSTSSSGAASTSSGQGLSLSFSNLSFRFPMPPICGSGSQQCQTEKLDGAAIKNPQHENLEHKRPKSMSALSLSYSASSATGSTSVSASPSQPSSTEKSYERCFDGGPENRAQVHSPATTTTKQQRRMGTIIFPPFAFLSRSSVGGALDQESKGSAVTNGKSLFS